MKKEGDLAGARALYVAVLKAQGAAGRFGRYGGVGRAIWVLEDLLQRLHAHGSYAS